MSNIPFKVGGDPPGGAARRLRGEGKKSPTTFMYGVYASHETGPPTGKNPEKCNLYALRLQALAEIPKVHEVPNYHRNIIRLVPTPTVTATTTSNSSPQTSSPTGTNEQAGTARLRLPEPAEVAQMDNDQLKRMWEELG